MAKLVYGFGCSHGPLLSTPPERWDLRADDDRKNPEHPFRGGVYTFPELVELRKGEKDFEKEMGIETRRVRHERNQRAMEIKIPENDFTNFLFQKRIYFIQTFRH